MIRANVKGQARMVVLTKGGDVKINNDAANQIY